MNKSNSRPNGPLRGEEMEGEEEASAKSTAGEADEQIPSGLGRDELELLRPVIAAHHTYRLTPGRRQVTSLLSQRVRAPAAAVWSVLRRFDKPQLYKHFIKSCSLKHEAGGGGIAVGCLREVSVISGLPASTSTERLDVLDDERRVFGFSIIGGEHRLMNYKSVTTASEFRGGEMQAYTLVLESYIVDVPDGNTEEDTRLFADTVVRLNLQKLAAVTEGMVAKDEMMVMTSSQKPELEFQKGQ